MTLSEAILLGARLKAQARGRLLDRSGQATCALGAAADALGAWDPDLPRQDPLRLRQRLREIFPVLCATTGPSGQTVEQAIVALNDRNGWSRERIAARVAEWEEAFGHASAARETSAA